MEHSLIAKLFFLFFFSFKIKIKIIIIIIIFHFYLGGLVTLPHQKFSQFPSI